MKVYFIRDCDADFGRKENGDIDYDKTEKSKKIAQERAGQLAKELKGVHMFDLYMYSADTVVSTSTRQEYSHMFFKNGRDVDIFGNINVSDKLNPKKDVDAACEKVSSTKGFKKLKFKVGDVKLHDEDGQLLSFRANKAMPYLFAAAGLSQFFRLPNYKLRNNLLVFLDGLVNKHRDNAVVLIFADNSVFKAMQKYPELHDYCYFGDEEAPVTEDRDYNSNLDVEPGCYHEMIIEKPEFSETKEEYVPVYEKHAYKKMLHIDIAGNQKNN